MKKLRREVAGQLAAVLQFQPQPLGLLFQFLQGGKEIQGIVHHQSAVIAQVVQQAGRLVVDVGHVPLEAVKTLTRVEMLYLLAQFFAQGKQQAGILKRRSVGAVGGEVLLGIEQTALDVEPFQDYRPVFTQHFAAWTDLDRRHLAYRALGGRVKKAQAFHLFAEEIDAHGRGQVGGPDVHNAATAGEDAGLLHNVRRLVAGLHPSCGQLFQAHGAAHLERSQRQAQFPGRQRLLHQGAGAGNNHGRWPTTPLQGSQSRQPSLACSVAPGDPLVRQRIGFSKVIERMRPWRGRGQPDRQLLHELLRHLAAGGKENQRSRPLLFQGCHHKRPRGRQNRLGAGLACGLVQSRQPVSVGGQALQECGQTGEIHVTQPLNLFMATSIVSKSQQEIASQRRSRKGVKSSSSSALKFCNT